MTRQFAKPTSSLLIKFGRYFNEVTDDKETFYNLWCQKEAYTKWKKDKIAHNLKADIDRCLIPLEGLPNDVVGYICY